MTTLEKIYNHFCDNDYKLTTDSRKIEPGTVYVSLKGERFDGNEFASQALKSGAGLVIVDNKEYFNQDDRMVLVEDSLQTLQHLASHHRQMLNLPVIALTGSNGKTTTKELLNVALSTHYNVLATSGNFNNHIGVPLTLLRATSDHEVMVIEMGANHVGEIEQLCKIALPDIGLITNIGKAHLEGFGGYNGVIKAKSEMYSFLKSTGGTIVYNSDDTLLTDLVGEYLPAVKYSPNKDFNLINSYPKLSFRFNEESFTTELVGAYNLANISSAISLGRIMKCETADMLEAICTYTPTNNRSQTVVKKGIQFTLDAYNANPTSMELAIKEFTSSSYQNKVMILGDMLELGVESPTEHKKTIEQCLSYEVECIFVGNCFMELSNDYPDLNFVKSVEDLRQLVSEIPSNTHCFVKGSRGIQLEKVLSYL